MPLIAMVDDGKIAPRVDLDHRKIGFRIVVDQFGDRTSGQMEGNVLRIQLVNKKGILGCFVLAQPLPERTLPVITCSDDIDICSPALKN